MKYNILTKKFLIEEYNKNKKSTYQIAKQIGCSFGTVRTRLIKFNIQRRTKSEAKKGNECALKDGRTLKKHYCIDCGKEINYKTWRYGQRRCSFCANKITKNGYINGQGNAPYPLEFNDELKLKIRKRDNYTCQKCNITEEEHLIVYGRVLYIHHIDYNKENCEENNLVTLCNECNLRVNSNRDYWQNYFIVKIEALL